MPIPPSPTAGERSTKYFVSAHPTKMLLRILGGRSPGNALVFIDTDAGSHALPMVKTVPSDFALKDDNRDHLHPRPVPHALPA